MSAGGMDRRTFIAGAGLGAGALILGGVPVGSGAARRRSVPVARTGSFPQGVASGEPTTRGITLWTRLGGYQRDRKLFVEISDGPDFRRVLYRRNVIARAEDDHTVALRIDGRRFLKPGERYWYRFETKESESQVGRFKTARPADSLEPVRIVFFSCQDWANGYYGAHATIAEIDDVDLVVCVGDYIYERNYYSGPRQDTLGANGDGEVQTLPEYRAKYQLYKSDPDLQAMHAAHPFAAIIDDHEVEDNWAGDLPGGETMDRRIPFEQRRANGLWTWYEYMPFRSFRRQPGRTYRSLRLGGMAEVFLTDQRTYRDDQPCGDTLFAPCPEADDPGRRYLGDVQKEWLKDELVGSSAAWKVIGSQLMLMALESGGEPINKDSWDGYAAERREILEHVVHHETKDIAVLTGDIHMFFAGEVGVDGKGPESVATEFVGGAVTSAPIGESLEEDTGTPPPSGAVADAYAGPVVRDQNPHIKYFEATENGYGVLEARRDELTVDYVAVPIEERSTAARRLARFRVERGNARIETLEGGVGS